MPQSAKKILVLGLDSVNFAALQPQLESGRMSALRSLVSGGASGILRSTTPAHTAPAWTTLATGKHPGIHGVLNFKTFDPRSQQAHLNSAPGAAHKTVWQLLDDHGLRVGVVGQPQSYPVRQLKHGFVVSGFETPSTECEFSWPPELKAEILQQVPGFCFRSERVRDPGAGKDWSNLEDFLAGMDGLSAENENAHALNLHLARSKAWDVLFLYYQATDPLFHKAWRWCDPETRGEDPVRAARIDRFFTRLDEMLAQILALPQAQDALVLLCSDHGHGPVHELVRVNGLLAELGYLKRGGLLAQTREAWRRATGKRTAKGLGIAVDWAGTRAYMPFEAIAGFIYLNRQGREPHGCLKEPEAENLLKELAARLPEQKSPHSGRPLFDAVKPVAEEYPGCASAPLPDLFALPARGINFVRKLSFGPAVELPAEKHRGTHRPEGFFCLHGSGVRPGPAAEASIADLAPTILATLGLPVPSDMTGQALSRLFAAGLAAVSGPPAVSEGQVSGTVYNDAETKLVEQRLEDLGYVD